MGTFLSGLRTYNDREGQGLRDKEDLTLLYYNAIN